MNSSKADQLLVELPDVEEIEEMDIEEVRALLAQLNKLNHALGNGTLKTLKECTQKCKSMIALAGELDAELRQ